MVRASVLSIFLILSLTACLEELRVASNPVYINDEGVIELTNFNDLSKVQLIGSWPSDGDPVNLRCLGNDDNELWLAGATVENKQYVFNFSDISNVNEKIKSQCKDIELQDMIAKLFYIKSKGKYFPIFSNTNIECINRELSLNIEKKVEAQMTCLEEDQRELGDNWGLNEIAHEVNELYIGVVDDGVVKPKCSWAPMDEVADIIQINWLKPPSQTECGPSGYAWSQPIECRMYDNKITVFKFTTNDSPDGMGSFSMNHHSGSTDLVGREIWLSECRGGEPLDQVNSHGYNKCSRYTPSGSTNLRWNMQWKTSDCKLEKNKTYFLNIKPVGCSGINDAACDPSKVDIFLNFYGNGTLQ